MKIHGQLGKALALLLVSCMMLGSMAFAVSAVPRAISLSASSFDDALVSSGEDAYLKLSGNNSLVEDGKLVLSQIGRGNSGAVFSTKPLCQGSGFSTAFQMTFSADEEFAPSSHHNVSDGFWFILAKNQNVIGTHDLGFSDYANMPNSIALEFDTFSSYWDTGESYAAHIALDKNGEISSDDPGKNDTLVSVSRPVGATFTMYFWIEYDAEEQMLYFSLSADGVRPNRPQGAYNINLADYIGNEYHFGLFAKSGWWGSGFAVDKWFVNNTYAVNGLNLNSALQDDRMAPTAPVIAASGANRFTLTCDDTDLWKQQYKLGDGDWTDYTEAVSFTGSAVTVTARAIDRCGNISDSSTTLIPATNPQPDPPKKPFSLLDYFVYIITFIINLFLFL